VGGGVVVAVVAVPQSRPVLPAPASREKVLLAGAWIAAAPEPETKDHPSTVPRTGLRPSMPASL
jgi:hypothetical protein